MNCSVERVTLQTDHAGRWEEDIETQARQILADLIARPTVNPMEQPYSGAEPVERPVTQYLEKLFGPFGVELLREPCSDIHENLLVVVKGVQNARPATLFESHADTVPAEHWEDRAFTPIESSGRIHGRGACDDKGSLAAMALALFSILDSGIRPPQTVLLLSAGDEECGQTGIKHFAKTTSHIIGRGVFGEPTSCLPIVQHKGCIRWDIKVHGRSSHSSEPEKGQNAIYDTTRIIERLQALNRELANEHASRLISPPTITVTMIQGGETRNALPAECSCAVDLRVVPGMQITAVVQRVQQFLEVPGVEVSHGPFQCFAPPLSTSLDSDLVLSTTQFCRDELQKEVQAGAVPYGSDASFMPQGNPALVLGPGSIEQAHTVDEYVDVQEVVHCAQIYRRIMMHDWRD